MATNTTARRITVTTQPIIIPIDPAKGTFIIKDIIDCVQNKWLEIISHNSTPLPHK
jgi:hypothetical protein